MVMAAEEEKPIQEVLSLPILLADRVIKSAQEAESFKPENSDLARLAAHLSQLLRSAARLTSTPAALYDRPIRRVSADLTKSLDRALTLARKCRHRKTNVLHHVLSITTAADFKKAAALLSSSLADIRWVLSIFNRDSSSDYDAVNLSLSLPPIASTDPILAWVWPAIAAAHLGCADAAQELAILAADNDRNKKIIAEENGIPPLLKMLKNTTNADAQTAAAAALCNLADDQSHVKLIAEKSGVQIIAKSLSESPARAQVILVNLISKMSEMNHIVQEEFGRENVTRPLVTLLGIDVNFDEFVETNTHKSIVELEMINRGGTRRRSSSSSSSRPNPNPNRKERERERETEAPEVKSRLKISCAAALCILARGNSFNSGKITDTKALLVLAKIIEREQGELKLNCLKVVMELALVAESNAELKRSAFKPTSTAAKVVFDQLLRVINEETSPTLVIPAVKSIGCLASMFPAKEKRIVQSLVTNLGQRNRDVAAEAARALSKFVCEDNYNRREHSEAIIEFDGVPMLMNLLRSGERGALHLHELVLLCNLAINAGNSKALEQSRALSVLEGAARHAVSQHPDVRELFAKAIHHLTIYQGGPHPHAHRHA